MMKTDSLIENNCKYFQLNTKPMALGGAKIQYYKTCTCLLKKNDVSLIGSIKQEFDKQTRRNSLENFECPYAISEIEQINCSYFER